MLTFWLMFLLVFVGLAILLGAGTLFFQGYLYNEPVAGIPWRAPAAAALLTVFLVFWCLLDYRQPGSYSATWFEPGPSDEEVFDHFWAVKGNQEILYQGRKNTRGLYDYYDAVGKPWSRSDASGVVEAIIVEEKDGQKSRFNADLTPDKHFKMTEGEPVRYVEADGRGRVMTETYIGRLPVSHWGATVLKLVLSILHLGLWFVCLWLVLNFHGGHAFGLAVVAWLVLSLTLVPILFSKTEEIAKQRSLPTGAAAAAIRTK